MLSTRVRILGPGEGHHLHVLGTDEHVKLTGDDTGGAYALVEESGPLGSGVPLHVHAGEDETFFVLTGAYRFVVGEREVVAGPGTMLFAPRGVPHSMEVVEGEPARVLTLIAPAGLERMFVLLDALGDSPPQEAVAAICSQFGIEFL